MADNTGPPHIGIGTTTPCAGVDADTAAQSACNDELPSENVGSGAVGSMSVSKSPAPAHNNADEARVFEVADETRISTDAATSIRRASEVVVIADEDAPSQGVCACDG